MIKGSVYMELRRLHLWLMIKHFIYISASDLYMVYYIYKTQGAFGLHRPDWQVFSCILLSNPICLYSP